MPPVALLRETSGAAVSECSDRNHHRELLGERGLGFHSGDSVCAAVLAMPFVLGAVLIEGHFVLNFNLFFLAQFSRLPYFPSPHPLQILECYVSVPGIFALC